MWQKRQRSKDAAAPAAKKLKDNIIDLYGTGELSADRTQDLLEDAAAFGEEVGRDDFQDVRRSRAPGSAGNIARDLRRTLLKRSLWPPVYIFEARMWSVKTKQQSLQKMAMLLPHEVLFSMSEVGSMEVLTDHSGLDRPNLERHNAITAVLQAPIVSVSLWGDGVPFSWDRKHSADIWTMSLPGQGHKPYRDLRITLTSLPHERVLRETQDDIFEVLAWSFKSLALGQFPGQRHDSLPWQEGEDTWRQRKAGDPLLHAAVVEVKGDWKQMAFCFGVPGWSRNLDKPLCWLCNCTKRMLQTEHGLQASWLQEENRLDHEACLLRILEDDGALSPIWSIPWLKTTSLRFDWLHIADQGITPVFLGGLFHLVLTDRQVGPNEQVRCGWLWGQIQDFYHRTAVVDRLHDLTVTMIKPKKGSISLTGSAAQIRALVPYGVELVDSWEDLSLERAAAKTCMHHLSTCYSFLSSNVRQEEGDLLTNALAFQRNLQGLFLTNPKRWQIRPKLHLFLELAAQGGQPSASWNYREESFGGSASKQSHRKGGWTTALAMSRSCLTKFCVREKLPRLVAPA